MTTNKEIDKKFLYDKIEMLNKDDPVLSRIQSLLDDATQSKDKITINIYQMLKTLDFENKNKIFSFGCRWAKNMIDINEKGNTGYSIVGNFITNKNKFKNKANYAPFDFPLEVKCGTYAVFNSLEGPSTENNVFYFICFGNKIRIFRLETADWVEKLRKIWNHMHSEEYNEKYICEINYNPNITTDLLAADTYSKTESSKKKKITHNTEDDNNNIDNRIIAKGLTDDPSDIPDDIEIINDTSDDTINI